MRGKTKKLGNLVLVLMLVAMIGPAVAVTVPLTTVQDADVRNGASADYGKGDRTEHYVNSLAGDSAKIYMQWTLPEDFGTLNSVSFDIVQSRGNGSWAIPYHVFGVNDGTAGEAWSGHGLTWNNAAANDTSAPSYFTADATGTLASFNSMIGSAGPIAGGNLISLSTAALDSFISADADGLITLMIARDTGWGAGAYDLFAAEDHGSLAGPTLVLDYTPVPEPVSIALLGIGSVLAMRRRRRQ